jgi:hypothetical protein
MANEGKRKPLQERNVLELFIGDIQRQFTGLARGLE